MFDKYQELYVMYETLVEENQTLKAMQASLPAPMTKETVTGLLNQKASEADSSSKQTEKALIKGEIDLKSFMSNYVD